TGVQTCALPIWSTQHAVHRLHLRAVGRRRAGARRQGVLRAGRQGDPAARPLDPREHGGAVRAGPLGGARACVRTRLRGRECLEAAQVGSGGALPADPALAHRQARLRGRPRRRTAGAGAVNASGSDASDASGAPAPRSRRRTADAPLLDWFDTRGWRPAPFQREAWRRYLAGEHGLLVTPTGSGKTLAALGGPLLQALKLGDPAATRKRGVAQAPRLRLLWITPLRALATDTVRAMQEPIAALGVPWTVAMRTGDASARDRRLARKGLSDVLVTTPESFALMLSYPDAPQLLAGVRGVVVDEWHELLGNKRGVLLQLCLARLRALVPAAPLWGLSATLGNLAEARDVLLPHADRKSVVAAPRRRRMTLETLLPDEGERFPWAGHLGLSQLQRVAAVLQRARSSLLFTNTRSQAELWHRALQSVWLDDPATLALHHGSLDASLRAAAETGLRDGSVRCVVATSSLDLGVDFPAVDQVLQVGSPKGMARLLQRGGRARHRPGEAGHVVCVPTHALELAEIGRAHV